MARTSYSKCYSRVYLVNLFLFLFLFLFEEMKKKKKGERKASSTYASSTQAVKELRTEIPIC